MPSAARARPAPDQRNQVPPLRPVHVSPCRFMPVIRPRPYLARMSSVTLTFAGPSIASTRRSSTAQCGSAGMASASRHSVLASPTQRLRQIRLPFS